MGEGSQAGAQVTLKSLPQKVTQCEGCLLHAYIDGAPPLVFPNLYTLTLLKTLDLVQLGQNCKQLARRNGWILG